jgi:hypothetical protein
MAFASVSLFQVTASICRPSVPFRFETSECQQTVDRIRQQYTHLERRELSVQSVAKPIGEEPKIDSERVTVDPDRTRKMGVMSGLSTTRPERKESCADWVGLLLDICLDDVSLRMTAFTK